MNEAQGEKGRRCWRRGAGHWWGAGVGSNNRGNFGGKPERNLESQLFQTDGESESVLTSRPTASDSLLHTYTYVQSSGLKAFTHARTHTHAHRDTLPTSHLKGLSTRQ